MNKKFKTFIYIVLGFVVCLICCSFISNNRHFDNNAIYVYETRLNGHTYVVANGQSAQSGVAIIHSASCNCKK